MSLMSRSTSDILVIIKRAKKTDRSSSTYTREKWRGKKSPKGKKKKIELTEIKVGQDLLRLQFPRNHDGYFLPNSTKGVRKFGPKNGILSRQLISHHLDVRIDLFSMNFVNLGKRENGDVDQNQERKKIETGTHVSETPKEDGEFDGIEDIGDEKVMTQNAHANTDLHHGFLQAFLAIPVKSLHDIVGEVGLEWIAIARFLHGGETLPVRDEGKCDGENAQSDVRNDVNHRIHGERNEKCEDRAEDQTSLLGAPPVDEIHDRSRNGLKKPERVCWFFLSWRRNTR